MSGARGRMVRAAATALLFAGAARGAGAQMPGMPEMKQMMRWEPTLFVLFDQLEHAPGAAGRPVNAELLSWYGGALNRVWVRAQSELATTERQGEVEADVLYGRLVDPWWDAVVGIRVDEHWGNENFTRVLATVGLIGLAPYRFEFEPTLFLSHKGELSARLEASTQILITQRLVAEPEFEVNAALQAVPQYDVRSGLNDYEMGLRLRYEFRREFAPYVGWSRSRRIGGSTDLADPHGDPKGESRFVFGLRLWR